MDLSLAIKTPLQELELVQKDLAAAAEVTESYISQLLTRKKSPPAPDRTDIFCSSRTVNSRNSLVHNDRTSSAVGLGNHPKPC